MSYSYRYGARRGGGGRDRYSPYEHNRPIDGAFTHASRPSQQQRNRRGEHEPTTWSAARVAHAAQAADAGPSGYSSDEQAAARGVRDPSLHSSFRSTRL